MRAPAAALVDQVRADPTVRAILDQFPGATIVGIRAAPDPRPQIEQLRAALPNVKSRAEARDLAREIQQLRVAAGEVAAA